MSENSHPKTRKEHFKSFIDKAFITLGALTYIALAALYLAKTFYEPIYQARLPKEPSPPPYSLENGFVLNWVDGKAVLQDQTGKIIIHDDVREVTVFENTVYGERWVRENGIRTVRFICRHGEDCSQSQNYSPPEYAIELIKHVNPDKLGERYFGDIRQTGQVHVTFIEKKRLIRK